MADAALNGQGSRAPFQAPAKSFTPEDESALRDALKRCSPATIEASLAYRRTHEASHLPAIIIGVIERFVEPDLRAKLKEADDELRLVEDLGIDSLTMMEIVIMVEDVLQMQINNDELRNLRSVGDVKTFIDCKVRGLPPPRPTRFLPIEQIISVMPIQPPFLFLNEASINSTGAQGKYKITGQEFFLQGHFKDNPVMPASMMLEALGQLAVLFLIESTAGEEGKAIDPSKIFFTSCEGVRAHRVCRPGDVLALTVKPKRTKMPLATFEGSIRVGHEKAAMAEEITLTFAYVESSGQAASVGSVSTKTAAGKETPVSSPPLAAAFNA